MRKLLHNFADNYKRNRRDVIKLTIIILLGSFLRLFNFPYRYGLGEETVRDAVVGIEAARELQLPLTGAFSSLGPFTFGPLYTYQVAFSYLVLPFNYSPWIYLSLISIFYIYIIYKIGEILNGKNFGLILAFIAAISPAQIISATHLTSHNNTNIFVALTIWIFLKIFKKNISYWWGFFLGVSLGFGMNLHYQMTGLFILVILLLFYKPKRYLYFITSIVGIFVTFIPLFIFELNNHWFNVRNMIYYAMYGKNLMYVPNRWLFYVRDFWPAFWADALGVPLIGGYISIVIVSVIFLAVLKKRKLTAPFLALIICFIFNFILLRYYWGHRFFGYLNFLRPFVFILTGFALLYLFQIKQYGKYIGSILFIFLTLFAVPRIKDSIIKDPFTMQMYKEVAILKNKFPSKKITVYKCTKKYISGSNTEPFSFAFLLDKDRLLTKSGVNIGFIGTKENNCISSRNELSKNILEIKDTNLLDLSHISKNSLVKDGWEIIDFKYIYDLNARWWFREQP
ncbi:MAG: hypothetical protein A3J14_01980 [Candidatus Levybacteria bacterium RIFCSPLOWO2_02_FULL_37_18]|nr:MAG: hypothetical protein A3J14_01980 [Candidatus Levybacteria bacterium RIFCSPLOWO2_02_FULL_37_18]